LKRALFTAAARRDVETFATTILDASSEEGRAAIVRLATEPTTVVVDSLAEQLEEPPRSPVIQTPRLSTIISLLLILQTTPTARRGALSTSMDHVAPPKIDRWGPGTRVPTIIISPFAKRHFIDHTTYDTTSIPKLIEARWGLTPIGERDAHAADLTNALQFN
jgi:hypothetical protein